MATIIVDLRRLNCDAAGLKTADHAPKGFDVGSAVAPRSRNHKVELRKGRDVSKYVVDFSEVAQGADYRATGAFIYQFFGDSPPSETNWNSVQWTFTIIGPRSVERTPLGGLWERGKVGYGRNTILLTTSDGKKYQRTGELVAERHSNAMVESLMGTLTESRA